jgi:hypothetical protein
VSAKILGPLAKLLSAKDWEAFAAAGEQGYLRAIIPVTQELIDKLNAGQGEVLGIPEQKIVVVLLPVPGMVQGMAEHQWTPEERQLMFDVLSVDRLAGAAKDNKP